MHKVIDDFLDKEDFIFVHNLIMNEPFPWFYMDSYRESGLEKDKTNNFIDISLTEKQIEPKIIAPIPFILFCIFTSNKYTYIQMFALILLIQKFSYLWEALLWRLYLDKT